MEPTIQHLSPIPSRDGALECYEVRGPSGDFRGTLSLFEPGPPSSRIIGAFHVDRADHHDAHDAARHSAAQPGGDMLMRACFRSNADRVVVSMLDLDT